jgi:hypothetical protein
LTVLHSVLRRASQGEGWVAVITGSPGTGKTALLRSVRDFGRHQGLRSLYARGREFERDIGFGVAAGLLGPPVHAAGRPDEARQLSAAEIARAEVIGAARPLGVALHIAGLVAPARSSVALLTRAVEVLETSPSALEHARALLSLGPLT